MKRASRKLPRAQRQKLRDALDRARLALAAYAPSAGIWPNQHYIDRFNEYSRELLAIVTHRLAAPEWDLEAESWSWNGHDWLFTFNYEGRANLALSTDSLDRGLLWVRAKFSLDPKLDLDQELDRLGAAAARYRDAVERLER